MVAGDRQSASTTRLSRAKDMWGSITPHVIKWEICSRARQCTFQVSRRAQYCPVLNHLPHETHRALSFALLAYFYNIQEERIVVKKNTRDEQRERWRR